MDNSTDTNGAAAVSTRNSAARLAAARHAVADKLAPIPPWSYGRIIVAKDALARLVKIGTNSRDFAARLTEMMKYATNVADSFDQQRDAFSSYYQLIDGDTEQPLTREVEVPGKPGQTMTVPVMKNEVEFSLLISDLLRDDASKNDSLGKPPRPFTYKELRGKGFAKRPDPELIAKLGPFADTSDIREEVDDDER